MATECILVFTGWWLSSLQWSWSFFSAVMKHPGKDFFCLLVQHLWAPVFLHHDKTDQDRGIWQSQVIHLVDKHAETDRFEPRYSLHTLIKILLHDKSFSKQEIQDDYFNLIKKKTTKYLQITNLMCDDRGRLKTRPAKSEMRWGSSIEKMWESWPETSRTNKWL